MPDLTFEFNALKKGLIPVGIDEVGRGCLAGPVVAAAVELPIEFLNNPKVESFFFELDDSKKLSSKKRKELSLKILESAFVQIAWAFPNEIDQFDILRASMLAMRRAANPFLQSNRIFLVDGNQNPYSKSFSIESAYDVDSSIQSNNIETIVKGDSVSLSIAAASIVAKVYRDEWMDEMDLIFPGYQFSKHKGYFTKIHHEAIRQLGPCKMHRLSFAPFKK